ncbi:MAG: hypothetical protein E7L40_12215 [Corynebacterium kroppenstedtii]|nr:hypothetical protein [Corynebacterium kroppenstedtii]
MTDILQNHYSQVKNPNPVFTPREGKKTLPFCRKLMAKAEGFTSRFDFSIHVAFLRVFAAIRLSVNLTAGSGILHGGMHHGSVMTSRRACVSN